jgi:endoglucanase
LPRLSSSLVSVLGLSFVGCGLFPSGGGGPPPGSGTTKPTGCSTTSTHVTPGGYYVNGNTVCTASGQAHIFHGVDRPSLESNPGGTNLSPADFQLMGSWKANAVRVALYQDYWLPGSADAPNRLYHSSYPALVDDVVNWAESAGMDVILDLHWSDAGVLGSCANSCQQKMADTNSLAFWSEVAARYKSDGRVLFELYNEPHDVPWSVWKNGGATSDGWMAVGMQQLYDAVRATGADNLVVIGGLNYAFDLSGVPNYRIAGYNILYATHPYNNSPDRAPTAWDFAWGSLTVTDPVIVTEFGDQTTNADGSCASTYSQEVITYADAHNASWTAWAWFPGGCHFPALITDWNGTPNAPGVVVRTALGGYHDPAPDGTTPHTQASDAGSTPVSDAGAADASDASSQ